MAIALPLIVNLFAPLQDAVQWLAGASHMPQPEASTEATAEATTEASIPQPGAADACALATERRAVHARPRASRRPMRAWGGPTRAPQVQRPLRVVRAEEERPCTHTSAGRMVISGRMADVCAELERLAAQEVAA